MEALVARGALVAVLGDIVQEDPGYLTTAPDTVHVQEGLEVDPGAGAQEVEARVGAVLGLS